MVLIKLYRFQDSRVGLPSRVTSWQYIWSLVDNTVFYPWYLTIARGPWWAKVTKKCS